MRHILFKFKHFLHLNSANDYLNLQKKGDYQPLLNYLIREDSKGISQMNSLSTEAFLSEKEYVKEIFIQFLDNAFNLSQTQCINEVFKNNKFNMLISHWFVDMFESKTLNFYPSIEFNTHLKKFILSSKENIFSLIIKNNTLSEEQKVDAITKILDLNQDKALTPKIDAYKLKEIIHLSEKSIIQIFEDNETYFFSNNKFNAISLMASWINTNIVNEDNWNQVKNLNQRLKEKTHDEFFLPENSNILSYALYTNNEFVVKKTLEEKLVDILNPEKKIIFEEKFSLTDEPNCQHNVYQDIKTKPELRELVLAYYEKEKLSTSINEDKMLETESLKQTKKWKI